MKYNSLRTAIGLVSLLLCLSAAVAFAQKPDKQYNDWRVFTFAHEGTQLCYIASSPIRQTGNYKKRGAPYVLVTHRKKNVDEMSVSSGYPYKKKSTVELTLGKKKYTLFTTTEVPDIAWAKDPKEDGKIVQDMKKAGTMTIKGHSRAKSHSVDTYSLKGFSSAYNRMKTLCK